MYFAVFIFVLSRQKATVKHQNQTHGSDMRQEPQQLKRLHQSFVLSMLYLQLYCRYGLTLCGRLKSTTEPNQKRQ
jgi:hypothetical protein